ncbi:MAG: hypothetical protein JSS04_10420 [Proteobacteria bacterium]|nr:hypothetical protein [Pseudomonadota bacterium]
MLSSIIVGGGPGGLGPLVWAAQHGHLPGWLDEGVAIVERSGRLGGSLGRYGINSDSLGGSYLECLAPDVVPESLRRMRDEPVAHEMAVYREAYPPLPLVDRYISRIGIAMTEILDEHPASALHLHTEARSVHLRSDGSVAVLVHGPDGRTRPLVAQSAVVAVGGHQPWRDQSLLGLRFADCKARLMPSNDLLSHAGLAEANTVIGMAGDRRIVILGGSHSAYAVAWALLELPAAARLKTGQVVIVQRRPPRVFYPDQAAADADSYLVHPGDVCQRTRRVNRMGGLRGHGRDIWRRIMARPGCEPETRIAILDVADLDADGLRSLMDEAALVAPCLGYRSATLPIIDEAGHRLALRADANGDAVGDDCRLVLADGSVLPNVYGIGLGTGFRPSLAMGCEPNFSGQANSLWLYQNDIGATIYRGIHEKKVEVPNDVPSSRPASHLRGTHPMPIP